MYMNLLEVEHSCRSELLVDSRHLCTFACMKMFLKSSTTYSGRWAAIFQKLGCSSPGKTLTKTRPITTVNNSQRVQLSKVQVCVVGWAGVGGVW